MVEGTGAQQKYISSSGVKQVKKQIFLIWTLFIKMRFANYADALFIRDVSIINIFAPITPKSSYKSKNS